MKAILFSDLHVNYRQLSNLKKFLTGNQAPELIICAGDILNMGEPVGFMEEFIRVIKEGGKPLFWVPGNNDFGRGYYRLQKEFPSLEGKKVSCESYTFTGVGGSPASWEGQYAGESIIDKKSIAGSIFVSHMPPPGAHNFVKSDYHSPSSNKKFADAPTVHICGHFHTRWGCAFLGQTKIINPGPLRDGRYVIMDLQTLSVEFNQFS